MVTAASGQRVILYADRPRVVGAQDGTRADVVEGLESGFSDALISALGLTRWPTPSISEAEQALVAFAACRAALYEAGDASQALSDCNRGATALTGQGVPPDAVSDILKGLWLAVHVNLIHGDTSAAEDLASFGLRLDPEARPPTSDFSPRVRRMVSDSARRLGAITLAGRPIGCHLVNASAKRVSRVVPGRHVLALHCKGQERPVFGGAVDWDRAGELDVAMWSLRETKDRYSVALGSVPRVISVLLAQASVNEVVIIRRAAGALWGADRYTLDGAVSTVEALADSEMFRWVTSPLAEVTKATGETLHIGTYWGIGVASVGVALLGAAFGTRAMANQATEETNQGVISRVGEANRWRTATWTLVGSGAAFTVIGTALSLAYGLGESDSSNESAQRARGSRVDTAPSRHVQSWASGAVWNF